MARSCPENDRLGDVMTGILGYSPGLTHEALLILARQFWFSGNRISSQEKKHDRCYFSFKLKVFSSGNHKSSSMPRKIMHLGVATDRLTSPTVSLGFCYVRTLLAN